jgi:methyltransferase OMS1
MNSKLIPLAALIFGGSAYGSFYYFKLDKMPLKAGIEKVENQRISTNLDFDYDKSIEMDEFLLRLNAKRRNLVEKAEGNCLELCTGTGRNLGFYKEAKSIQFIDKSKEMLRRAVQKYYTNPNLKDIPVSFRVLDASDLPYKDNTFDSVIQTFGLCSCENPSKILHEMKRVLKPGGKVFLLEHGRSTTHRWINGILDKTAEGHAMKWGCWWNREIKDFITDAGLEVLEEKKYHFGTTYHYILKNPKKLQV